MVRNNQCRVCFKRTVWQLKVKCNNIFLIYPHYIYIPIALFLFFTITLFISSCSCNAIINSLCLLIDKTVLIEVIYKSIFLTSFAFVGDSICTNNVSIYFSIVFISRLIIAVITPTKIYKQLIF